MIFVNFKTYEQGTGAKAAGLVRILAECEQETGVQIIPVVQVVDVRLCVGFTKEVWVQHIDEFNFGKYTGWILPEAVVQAGAVGTLLNHSEHKFPKTYLSDVVKRCNKVGLKTLIFAEGLEELQEIIQLKPTYVAYEPPELVASKETSVAKSKSEVISQAAKLAQEAGIQLIVGAGVKDGEDVKVSLQLGATGVAVSSAVVLAEEPKKVVMGLLI